MMLVRSPAKERQQQREDDTQDDRGRERKVKGEVAAPDREVSGKPAERDTRHHQQPQSGNPEAKENQRLTHHTTPPRRETTSPRRTRKRTEVTGQSCKN